MRATPPAPWLALPLAPLLVVSALGCDREAPLAPVPPPRPEQHATQVEWRSLDGFLPVERARPILESTSRFEVRASTERLGPGERAALERLLRAGPIVQRLYERSRHAQAELVHRFLFEREPPEAEREQVTALRELYTLFAGPIATSLDRDRVAIAPVAPYSPARNLSPSDATAEALRDFAESNPHEELLGERAVVRARTEEALAIDRAVLDRHPVLDVLHPGLRERLSAPAREGAFYAVPYSVAYAEEVMELYVLLSEAAREVRGEDPDLADYLAQRARDLLSDDYQGGDAAWVAGRYRSLNAQIGAYETYDDHLMGAKAFWSLSVLVREPESSDELARSISGLGAHQAALPGGPYPPVRAEIPIGIYDVVADFGQARGGNTATILPNEERNARRFGRTILIRRNVLTNDAFVESAQRRFRAVVAPEHAGDLLASGSFDRTVWHEVGHYLGAHLTADGRPVTDALGALHNTLEEMKADLASLFVLERRAAGGEITQDRLRAAQAAGILRVLLASRPGRDEAYGTMQLMQQRWFFDRGLLSFTPQRKLRIDYARYAVTIEALLAEVLALQRRGDPAEAERFVERWAVWDDEAQGVIARAQEGTGARFWLPRYEALER